MIIGVTGLIGSGKSTAAKILGRLGAKVIDADKIGHQVLRESAELRRKLAKAFGSDILDRRGMVIKSKLAAQAFVDQQGRDQLNRLTHPYLLRELKKQVAAAKKRFDVVVIDAALLLYWNMDKQVDYTLVIHAGRETRHRRMAARGLDRPQVQSRERAQLPYREFQHRADRIILNNGSQRDLERKLSTMWQRLNPHSTRG